MLVRKKEQMEARKKQIRGMQEERRKPKERTTERK